MHLRRDPFGVQLAIPGCFAGELSGVDAPGNCSHQCNGQYDPHTESIKGSFARVTDVFHQKNQRTTQADKNRNKQKDDDSFE